MMMPRNGAVIHQSIQVLGNEIVNGQTYDFPALYSKRNDVFYAENATVTTPPEFTFASYAADPAKPTVLSTDRPSVLVQLSHQARRLNVDLLDANGNWKAPNTCTRLAHSGAGIMATSREGKMPFSQPRLLVRSTSTAHGHVRDQPRSAVRGEVPDRASIPTSTGQWEDVKSIIEELYLKQNIRVQDVSEIMEHVYKFKAT